MTESNRSTPAPRYPPDVRPPEPLKPEETNPPKPADPANANPNPQSTGAAGSIRVLVATPATPENQALYEAGKEILVDSLKTGRDFASFMITLSVGGIGVYTGLIKLVLPANATLTLLEGVIAIVPALVYLVAAGAFVLAYAPRTDQLNVNIPAEIEANRNATVKARKKWTDLGLILFASASFVGILVTFALLADVLTPAAPSFV